MTTRVIREKINTFRRLAKEDSGIQDVFNIVMLYYPILLDNPEETTESMIKGYNRIIETNISEVKVRKMLLI